MNLILTSLAFLAGTAGVAVLWSGAWRMTLAQVPLFLAAAAVRQSGLLLLVYGGGQLLSGPAAGIVIAAIVIGWAAYEALNLTVYRFFGVSLLSVLPHLPIKAGDKGGLGSGLMLLRGNMPWLKFSAFIVLAAACLLLTDLQSLMTVSATSLGLAGLIQIVLSFRKSSLSASTVEQYFLRLGRRLPNGRLHKSIRKRPQPRAVPQAPPVDTILVILSESAGRQVPSSASALVTLGAQICALGGRSADWIAPTNALTASTCTDISIPCLMTGCAPFRDLATLHAMPTLFDLAKARGMQTLFYTSSLLGWANFDQFFDSAAIDEVFTPKEGGFAIINELSCDDYLIAERFCQTIRAATGPLLAVVYLNGLHIPFQSNSACAVPDRIGNRLQRASYINETCHGLILDALTDSGRYDNALILCAGDHGEDSRITGTDGENHLARLTQLTDSVIHPMFLVKPPANLPVAERRTLERNAGGLVSLLDIAPTIASALDLDPPAGMAFDGQSLFQPIPEDRIHITMNTNEWRSWPRSAVMIAQDQARICIDYQDTSHLCTDANGHPFAAQDDRKDRLLAEALKFPAVQKAVSDVFIDKARRDSGDGHGA